MACLIERMVYHHAEDEQAMMWEDFRSTGADSFSLLFDDQLWVYSVRGAEQPPLPV